MNKTWKVNGEPVFGNNQNYFDQPIKNTNHAYFDKTYARRLSRTALGLRDINPSPIKATSCGSSRLYSCGTTYSGYGGGYAFSSCGSGSSCG